MATYYVNKVGSDSNNGLANTAAGSWLTIQKASNSVLQGDIVRVGAGLYEERVSISGNSATYVSDTGGSILRGFNINNSTSSIIGFELTHQDNQGAYLYAPLTILTSTGVQIIDNHIHHTDIGAVTISQVREIVIRGNNIEYVYFPGYPLFSGSSGAAAISSTANNPSTGVIIEYNTISNTADFLNPFGDSWIIRNNYLGPSNTGTVAHIDFVQNNANLTNILIENNWHQDNHSSDNHFYLNQLSGSNNWIIRGNVSYLTNGGMDVRRPSFHYFYHNSFIKNTPYNSNSFQMLFNLAATGHVARNNIWYQSNTNVGGANPYSVSADCSMDYNYDCRFEVGNTPANHDITADPLYSNVSGGILYLTSNSPIIGSGGPITTTIGSGTNSNILTVTESGVRSFWTGDFITVNNGARTQITGIYINSNNLVTTTNLSWSNGDWVRWRGNKDIGAHQYRSDNYNLLGNLVGNDVIYTVNTPDDELVRYVIFYEDNIPKTTKTSSPYTHTSSGGVISAKIYAYYAYSSLVVNANKSWILPSSCEC